MGLCPESLSTAVGVRLAPGLLEIRGDLSFEEAAHLVLELRQASLDKVQAFSNLRHEVL